MRVAVVTADLLIKGGAQRQLLYLARGLEDMGHDVVVYTYVYSPEECFPELTKGLSIRYVVRAGAKRGDPSTESTEWHTILAKYTSGRILSALRNLSRRLGWIGRVVSKSLTPVKSMSSAVLEFLPEAERVAQLMLKDGSSFDIVNPHMFPANWVASFYSRRRGTPVVWMCNDPPLKIGGVRPEGLRLKGKIRWWLRCSSNWLMKRYDRWLVRKMQRIVVLDHRVKKIVQDRYRRDAQVVRSGVDLKRFEGTGGNTLRKKYDIPEENLIILCLGILFKYRRFEDVISAMRILGDRRLTLFIVGSSHYDRSYAQELYRWAESEGVRDRVIFVDDFIPDELIPRFYKGSDIFVFPNEQQTWGLAVVEAMAAGIPCVVSRGAGVHEVLVDNETALLFEPRDPAGLASKVSALANDPRLRESLGARGKDFVVRNLSWDKYSRNMLTIFSEIANSR